MQQHMATRVNLQKFGEQPIVNLVVSPSDAFRCRTHRFRSLASSASVDERSQSLFKLRLRESRVSKSSPWHLLRVVRVVLTSRRAKC